MITILISYIEKAHVIRRIVMHYLMFILLMNIVALSFSTEMTYGQLQQEQFGQTKNTLLLPSIYLQYGPDPSQGIIMWFRAAEFLNDLNQTMIIYDPATQMDAYNETTVLSSGDNVQPTFDSYFSLNRLVPQVMPNISNVSVEIAQILNAQNIGYITQAKFASPIKLSHPENDDKAYLIPQGLQTGVYLANLTVYFPDYKINATYSNSVYINSSTT
jgi:hypothetical protein